MTVTTPPPPIPVARARRSDPQTSHAAAASLDADTLRDSQRAVLEVLRRIGPSTDERLVSRYEGYARTGEIKPQSPSGIRSRRNELAERDFVRDTGTRTALRSGRNAVVWEVTP